MELLLFLQYILPFIYIYIYYIYIYIYLHLPLFNCPRYLGMILHLSPDVWCRPGPLLGHRPGFPALSSRTHPLPGHGGHHGPRVHGGHRGHDEHGGHHGVSVHGGHGKHNEQIVHGRHVGHGRPGGHCGLSVHKGHGVHDVHGVYGVHRGQIGQYCRNGTEKMSCNKKNS